MKSDALVSGEIVVAQQNGGAVVGRQQNIQISVAIEIAVAQSAAHARLREIGANAGGDVVEIPVSIVQKKLRRLRVADVAANVAHCFIDVAIGHGQVHRAIKIDVEKGAAESQRVHRRK